MKRRDEAILLRTRFTVDRNCVVWGQCNAEVVPRETDGCITAKRFDEALLLLIRVAIDNERVGFGECGAEEEPRERAVCITL